MNLDRQNNPDNIRKKLQLSLVFLLAFILTFIKVRGYDLFWHIRIAEYQSVFNPLKHNLFSFNFPDYPYSNFSALFSEAVSFVVNIFGIGSLTLFQAVIVGLSFSVLYLSVKRGRVSHFWIFIILLLSIFTLRYRLLFRPHNLTYLFFAVNVYLLMKLSPSLNPSRLLVFLFLNQVLWANTHTGFILGIINPILLMIGVIFTPPGPPLIKEGDRYGSSPSTESGEVYGSSPFAKGGQRGIIKLLITTTVILITASLINPSGYKIFLEVINPFLGKTKDIFEIIKVHEWQATDSKMYFSFFGALIIVSVLNFFHPPLISPTISPPLLRGGWGWVEVRVAGLKFLPFYLFYLILAVKFVRFTDFFALSAFFVSLNNFSSLPFDGGGQRPEGYPQGYKGHKGGGWRVKYVSIAKIIFLLPLLYFSVNDYLSNPTIPKGYGTADFFYPKGAVDFIEKNGIKGKIFNSYAFGGYIIYRLYPDSKPIIDGRLCYPMDFIKLYADAHEKEEDFWKLLNQYPVDMVLVDFDHPKLNFFMDSLRYKYALLYFDDSAMLFLKRDAQYNKVISQYEYRYLKPRYVAGYDERTQAAEILRIKGELEKVLQTTPSNRAKVMYGNLLLRENKAKEAEKLFFEVINEKSPNAKTEAYNNLGVVKMAEGNMKEAVVFFKKALKLDNQFYTGRLNLAEAYHENKNYIRARYHYFIYMKHPDVHIDAELSGKIQKLDYYLKIFAIRIFTGITALVGIIFIVFRVIRRRWSHASTGSPSSEDYKESP